MKLIFLKILILLLILFSLVPISFAQNANNSSANQQNTEILGENEHLPFMQSEQTPASAEPSSGGLLLKTLGAMLLIVGLIFFGAWGAKKLGFGGIKSTSSGDDLELAILSTVSIGNGRTISTLRFGERILVIGSTPQSITLLAEETTPEKVSLKPSRSVAEMLAEENGSFANKFEAAQTKLNLWEGKQI